MPVEPPPKKRKGAAPEQCCGLCGARGSSKDGLARARGKVVGSKIQSPNGGIPGTI